MALAAVGSFARREAGPLSDFDLVLLHYGRSLTTTEVTALADRLWYPVWDAGARLDHSVRTVDPVPQRRRPRDLTAAVGLLDLAWVAGDARLVAAARRHRRPRLARQRPQAAARADRVLSTRATHARATSPQYRSSPT